MQSVNFLLKFYHIKTKNYNLRNIIKNLKFPLTKHILCDILLFVAESNRICESGGTGRRARLRGVWIHRTGSSPVSRTTVKQPRKGCFTLNYMRMWRNWQTRWIQVPVKAISYGFKSLHPHQKSTSFDLSIFYPLRSNGISSPCGVRCISSAPSGLYIITHRRASQLRNDDIQFLAELMIYKDFVFDDIHACGVIRT